MQKEQEQFQGKNIIYTDEFTQQIRKKLLVRRMKKRLPHHIQYMQSQKQDEMYEILPYIKQVRLNRIDYSKVGLRIILQLVPIHFPNLKALTLSNCYLNNIQFLTFMSIDKIQYLNLNMNCITQTKPISKLNWPNISQIQTDKNYLSQIDYSRMKIINVKSCLQSINQFINKDIIYLAKMEAVSHLLVNVCRKRIIKNVPVRQCIERKYHYPDQILFCYY